MSTRFIPAGVDTRRALTFLTQAGVTAASIAQDLKLHRTTVARWARGGRPSAANWSRLRELVEHLLADTLAGNTIADAKQGVALQEAVDALMSLDERTDLARLADSINRSLDAAANPHRSITKGVDPFALIGGDRFVDALDDAFGPALAAA